MKLFPYASAIALSQATLAFLSPAFILNLMQFSVSRDDALLDSISLF